LKKGLMTLDIDISDKVVIWLTYGRKKSISFVVKPKDCRQLEKYFKKCGLTFNIAGRRRKIIYPGKGEGFDSIKTGLYCVSTNPGLAKEAADILTNVSDLYHPSVSKKLGLLCGYPKAAVLEFSRSMANYPKNGVLSKTLLGNEEIERLYSNQPWLPYLFYRPRKNHVEDLERAKSWASYVKSNFPQLTRMFEGG